MGHRLGFATLALAGVLIAGPCWAADGRLPAGLQTRPTDAGLALADAQGRPVYRLDLDHYSKRRKFLARLVAERCAKVCDELWRPVAAPQGFVPAGDWGVEQRAGAPAQLTYKGAPLYSFVGKSLDEAAAAPVAPSYFSSYAATPTALHDGVPVATIYWHAALYEPPAPEVATPAGITLHWAKARFVFADASGKSLYTPGAGGGCASDCGGLRPLAAPLAALPVGAWRPVEEKDGERVWSYRGRIVYEAADAEPASGSAWQALELR